MPTGDWMIQCPHCKLSYYAVNGHDCKHGTPLDGKMATFFIVSEVLPDDEIQRIYQQGRESFGLKSPWYKMWFRKAKSWIVKLSRQLIQGA